MPNLIPQSPLMQSIAYQCQEYFTSQYFHAQYLANSPHGGKYRRHTDFLRACRHIPAYPEYLARSDIVSLEWDAIKASIDVGKPEWLSWKSVFRALNWNPLTLLNATAQAALSHHLDDLASQAMSVAINRQAAKTAATAPALPVRTVEQDMAFYQSCLDLLRSIGQLEQRDTLMVADKVRTLLLGDGQTAGLPTFFVAERVAALGYHLTRTQEATVMVTLGKLVAKEWRFRHKDDADPTTWNPPQAMRFVDGATRSVNTYPRQAALWIDPIIHGYLQTWPGVRTLGQVAQP